MAEVALQGRDFAQPATSPRSRRSGQLRFGDVVFFHLTRGSAIAVLIILGGVIVSLITGSSPALRPFGLGFLVAERWNPVTEHFGAVAPIYGTVVTSFIAMLIAVPIGLLIAVFLTELCRCAAARSGSGRVTRRHPQYHLRHLGVVHALRRSCNRPFSRS